MPAFVTVAAGDRDADSPITVALVDALYNNVIAGLEGNSGLPIGWATGVCFWVPYHVPPLGTIKANGAAVSRTTYADLFGRIAVTQNGTFSTGSPIITGIADTSRLFIGDPLSGVHVPGGATVLTWDSASQITMSANAVGTGTALFTDAPWGIGDGSTTFNVPELRGEFVRGWDNLRGIDAGRRLGAAQADQLAQHLHEAGTLKADRASSSGSGVLAGAGAGVITAADIDVSGNTANTGGTENSNENRPRNQAGLWVIKYRG